MTKPSPPPILILLPPLLQALRQSGLLDVTMKTAELLRKNHDLQREIEDLQRQTKNFVLSVLSNPENRHILENIRSGAQLYEVRD